MGKISLGDIESRLGKSASRPSHQYDSYGDPVPQRSSRHQDDDDDDDESTISAGFIATCFAAFLAVGGGTYFYLGGDVNVGSMMSWKGNSITTDYVSVVDSYCRKGWVKEQDNRDNMHCFFTKNVRRLCNPDERKHLVMTIDQYWTDEGAFDRKMAGAAFDMIGKANTEGMRLGMEAAKMDQMTRKKGVSEEEQMRQFEKVAELAGSLTQASDDILRTAKRNEHSGDDINKAMIKLVEGGYLSESDFGWYKPRWVNKIFEKVKSGEIIPGSANCPT
jgi:hypothetical protein